MGRITSSIGLITGVPIQDTVNQLMAIEAQPRNLLASRAELMSQEQAAIAELTSRVLTFQFHLQKFTKPELFQQKTASSSNLAKLAPTVTGTPLAGTYQYTPVQQAQSQQLLSSAFTADDTPLGAGTFSLEYGGAVDEGISLATLNGGTGVQRGKIRITDRSGASGEIDLRFARSVDDVLAAVNSNSSVNVRLEVHGDSFRLVDLTGQTSANLRVQELEGGTTGADLGLGGIDVAASQADGGDVVRLYDEVLLADMNDGLGFRFNGVLPELEVNFRDGSDTLRIDFNRLASDANKSQGTRIAANGATAQLEFTATATGEEFDGFAISYVDDPAVTAGSEVVEYDAGAKTLQFRIDEGNTTADHIITALAGHVEAGAAFTAEKASGLLFAEATTNAANGADAELNFLALADGPDFDGFAVSLVNDAAAGFESVDYDDQAKTIVFHIAEGTTTAATLETVAANHGALSADFEVTANSGGGGFVTSADSATTSGGVSGLVAVGDGATTFGGAALEARSELTVADLLETINEAGQGRLQAQISAGGDRISILDLTDDLGGTFAIAGLFGLPAAADLGIEAAAAGDEIASHLLHSGLKSTLLRNLDGGAGLDLDSVQLTDRSGTSVTVDLSAAETLQDVIDTLNADAETAGVAIAASFNDAHSGLVITDSSGSTSGPLIVASAGAKNSADQLRIAVNAHVVELSGGDLNRQTVNENTLLASFNGGRGVVEGSFRIENSDGLGTTVPVDETVQTVGDLIEAINSRAIDVAAQINDAGDGIVLVDTAQGSSTLKVLAAGGTQTAGDLHLLGTSITDEQSGEQRLEAGNRFDVVLDDDDTLDDLIEKLNDLGADLIASKIGDGSAGNPYRIAVQGTVAGEQSNLRFDTSGVGFSFQQTVRAQDALLLLGSPDNAGAGVLISSLDNSFDEVLPGVQLQVKGASDEAVSITISATDSDLVKAAQDFVGSYNAIKGALDELTFFNPEDNTTGLLTGSVEALRVDTGFTNLLSSRFFGVGSIQSLEAIGIQLDQEGELSLDAAKLQTAYAADPESVEEFFTAENGVAEKFDTLVEQLAGEGNSLLVNRAGTLADKVNSSIDRIKFLDELLEKRRTLLTEQFVRMELIIGQLQNDLAAIESLQVLQPISTTSPR